MRMVMGETYDVGWLSRHGHSMGASDACVLMAAAAAPLLPLQWKGCAAIVPYAPPYTRLMINRSCVSYTWALCERWDDGTELAHAKGERAGDGAGEAGGVRTTVAGAGLAACAGAGDAVGCSVGAGDGEAPAAG